MRIPFKTGRLLMTRAINEDLQRHPDYAAFLAECFRRHLSNDWGDMPREDKLENAGALINHTRLMSSYNLPPPFRKVMMQEKVWIITEADRSATTVLYPDDY